VISGRAIPRDAGVHWAADNALLSGLRLGLRETLNYLYSARPSLDQFDAWVFEKNGGRLSPRVVGELNGALAGESSPNRPQSAVLSQADLNFWDENGYAVLHDAVPTQQCEAAATAICSFLKMDSADPATWYGGPQGHSIWIPVNQDPALWANRDSPRIKGAFAQLWGRDDLWVTVDQGGMNPPEKPGWNFPGPHLHFDVSLAMPMPFGTQGILYLTDTEANQGAFRCVPGFHKRIESWLNGLPAGANPRAEDLEKPGAIPIAGRAGDLIVWHQALPHGASANRASKPRVVQYINMRPTDFAEHPVWK
jgi:hypothetical protein